MSPLALPRDSDVLTLQAVVHGEMPGLFESPAHDRPLEECVDGVHLGGRKLWVSGAPVAFQVAGTHDPQPPALAPGLRDLTRGDERNPRSDQGQEQRSYLVKEMFQAAVELVLLV